MIKKLVIGMSVISSILVGYSYYFFQHEIPRFRPVVENVLYRSGQPRCLGLSYIRAKGIKTIVNLRSRSSDGVQEEIDFAKENGMRHYNLEIGTSPKALSKTAKEFMSIMDDPSNLPVLVHCSRGKERSGIMSAVYLINKNRMSNEVALAETFRLGLTPGRMTKAEYFLLNYNKMDYGFNDAKENKVTWLE